MWASGSDVYVEFTSGNLTVGEEYQLIWNLSDSTSNWGHVTGHYGWNIFWNATSTTSVENSTISGLADGVYYFHATLVNQGSHVATDMTMIQVGNNTGGSGGSGGTTGPAACNLDVLPSTRPHNGGPNQTEWTYGVDIFDAYAHHTCLDAGMYDWNFSLYDANGRQPSTRMECSKSMTMMQAAISTSTSGTLRPQICPLGTILVVRHFELHHGHQRMGAPQFHRR